MLPIDTYTGAYEIDLRTRPDSPTAADADSLDSIADSAVDRHVRRGLGSREAIRFIDPDGDSRSVTYARLSDQGRRFAGALDLLGIPAGTVVLTLLPRRWELHTSMVGALRHGSSVLPLASSLGPSSATGRLNHPSARILVTTDELRRRHLTRLPDDSALTMLVTGPIEGPLPLGAYDLRSLMAQAPDIVSAPTDEVSATVLHQLTDPPRYDGRLTATGWHRPTDVVWYAADSDWITADPSVDLPTLMSGATAVVDEGEFDVDRWYSIVERERVTVWYLGADDLRWLRWAGAEAAEQHDLMSLRHIITVGEPPSSRLLTWARETLGVPVYQNSHDPALVPV